MRAIAIGDNCIDVYVQNGALYPGGNAANVAVYLSRCGAAADYMGAVGTDPNGDFLLQALASKGVGITSVKRLAGSTARSFVRIEDGERIFGDYEEGVMEKFSMTEKDLQYISNFDLVHTAVWGRAVPYLPALKRTGVPLSFDCADKLEDPLVDKILPYADYLLFSYTQDDAYIRGYLKEICRQGPLFAIATLGENGSIAFDGEQFYKCGIEAVKVADTMGAGDSYIAGFLYALFQRLSIEECMRAGAHSAAVTLSYRGAW